MSLQRLRDLLHLCRGSARAPVVRLNLVPAGFIDVSERARQPAVAPVRSSESDSGSRPAPTDGHQKGNDAFCDVSRLNFLIVELPVRAPTHLCAELDPRFPHL